MTRLTFQLSMYVAAEIGRIFDLFDWTGVAPNGSLAVSTSYGWDLSNLYTTGEITLTAVPEPPALALLVAAIGAFLNRDVA